MKRIHIYGCLALLALTFAGGFFVGRMGGEPERLSEISLARLRLRADELRANVAAAVASREEAYAKASTAAGRAKALADAAGVTPDVVVGFDLRPAASAEADGGTGLGVVEMATPVEGDPCAPGDFAVSGTVQRLGGSWALDAMLTHTWDGAVVWRYPLHGKVSVYDESARPERKWFAGPVVTTDGALGGMLGREWSNVVVFGAATRGVGLVGVGVRW